MYAVKILSRYKYDATREVKYLSKCQGHENIVKLYDVLQDDLHTYIIMELLTGGELFERIRRQRLFGEYEAAILMRSLISAIQYMHSQGVVHRDLKPENILYADSSPDAKVPYYKHRGLGLGFIILFYCILYFWILYFLF